MALVITSSSLESFPSKELSATVDKPSGFLTSNYKKVSNSNLENVQPSSLFGVRQRVKTQQLLETAAIETIIKLTVFGLILSAIL